MGSIPQRHIAEIVEAYRASLIGSTRLAYGGDIREYVKAVGPGSVLSATAEFVANYIGSLELEPKAARASSALRSFYRWLAQNDHVGKDPTAYLRFKDIWSHRVRPDVHAALIRERFTSAEIATLKWADVLCVLVKINRTSIRIGRRSRPIRPTTRRLLIRAFEEAVRSGGLEASLRSSIVPTR